MALLRIRISEEDAERIGVPRDLELNMDKLMGRELITMERVTRWSYEALTDALTGRPVFNAVGQPVWETEDDGVTRKTDPAGNPIQAIGFDIEALHVVVWLAARRIKGEVPWESIDLDVTALEFGDDEGKAPANRAERRAASKTTTTTTKPRSARSSASRRGTSGTG